MKKIKIEFYESGIGETTIITFPDKSIGIIDAYPSSKGTRPDILSLISGKNIRFVCLTHPHDDHAKDLVPILEKFKPKEFWNTVPSSKTFFYEMTNINKFHDAFSENYRNYKQKVVKSLIHLFGTAIKNKIDQIKITDRTAATDVAGVKISFLAPSIHSVSNYDADIHLSMNNKNLNFPRENTISSVISFQFGEFIFIHGGDAEAKYWEEIYKKWNKKGRKLASLFKIPHHGARNGLFLDDPTKENNKNYMKMFCKNSKVIFFGDDSHPDKMVFFLIQGKTKNMFSLINCFSSKVQNPLGIPGGKLRRTLLDPCNAVVSIEADENGNIEVIQGRSCKNCDKFTKCLENAQFS